MTIPQKRKPWMKWYPRDWRAEVSLMMCSRAARSLWMDMLGLMHESTLVGYLLINGKKPTPEQLAKVLGDDIGDMSRWLDELDKAGVYSETDDGIVYSRRMVRDEEMAQKGRDDIKKRGGAWTKYEEKEERPPAKDPNRVPKKDSITQRPEARDQKNTDLVGPVPEPTAKAPKGYPEDFEEFWVAYPRSPNMSKAEAGKSWVKLKAAGAIPDKAAMMRAVTAYRKFLADQSKGRKDPYPAAHAATWLNQRRWEGFLEAPAAPVGASINTGPGWETEFPETWGMIRTKFREMHGSDAIWDMFFASCRPNGSAYTLKCPNAARRDTLEERFGLKLAKLFGREVSFVFEPIPMPKPQPSTQAEIRH